MQSVTTNADGYYEFYVPDGSYIRKVAYGDIYQLIADDENYDLSEMKASIALGVKVPDGEDALELPPSATRAAKYAKFDDDGGIVATDQGIFLGGSKIGDPGAFGYADDDLARVYLERGLADGIQHTFRVITSGIGDNTTYRGVTNAYFEFRDRDDVDASNKGVGYALHLSVVPRVTRDNVPFDDVAGLTIGNTTGITEAKATDAVYISNNAFAFPANEPEWYSLFTADCGADVGIQFKGPFTSAKWARVPNASYLTYRNQAGTQDVKAIGVTTDNVVEVGDAAQAARVDLKAPAIATEGLQVTGYLQANNGWFGVGAPTVTAASTYTITATDNDIICNGSGCTITLPAAGSFTGRILYIKTTTAFAVISASSNVVPLSGGSAGTAICAATGGKWGRLVSDGANWQIMAGN